MLAGARYDKPIDADTDHHIVGMSDCPLLSSDDGDTKSDELQTHLLVTGTQEEGEGNVSMGACWARKWQATRARTSSPRP